jgi:phosphoglucomutase
LLPVGQPPAGWHPGISALRGNHVTKPDSLAAPARPRSPPCSGTGSAGATIRLYIETYTNDASLFEKDAQEVLKSIIGVALDVSKLQEFSGRDKPTVIT